jgi:hypothetical protein
MTPIIYIYDYCDVGTLFIRELDILTCHGLVRIITASFIYPFVPNCWFENIFPLYMLIKPPNKLVMWFLWNLLNVGFCSSWQLFLLLMTVISAPHDSYFCSSWQLFLYHHFCPNARAFSTIIAHQLSLSRPYYTRLWHPSTNKLYRLPAGVITYVREGIPWVIIIVPIYIPSSVCLVWSLSYSVCLLEYLSTESSL